MKNNHIKTIAKKLEHDYPYTADQIERIIGAYSLQTVNEANARKIIEANMVFSQVRVTGGIAR